MRKRILTTSLATLLSLGLISLPNNNVIAASTPTNNHTFSQKIYDVDTGFPVGEIKTSISSDTEELSDGTKIITLNKIVTIVGNNQKNQTKKSVDTIKITPDGEYFINGKKLSKEELSKPLTNKVSTMAQSGGLSWLTSYNEINKDYYVLKSYPDADFWLDKGIGKQLTWYTKGNYKVSDFKAYANTVSSCRSSLVTLGSTLAAEIGTAVLTVETVIGAIAAGGAAAITAREIYSQSTTAHEAMANAYSILEDAY
ncbi:hypothetical protein I532_01375 [Brevibacillus borstelensis AK1]|uniref:Uncharacterized protein n=1 Tax=Brevibacillus borstelensis AK1 TaxID=1300222 RepID=M8EFH4_9BACL|nr:hypothetical protein [Brevibacillus borstelensis]EMT54215.1 hypothetical protein I532_01375 [Brevibacillus borstelensis AK1]